MNPYPEYRESELDWIARVPKHWKNSRVRFVAELNPSKSELAALDRSTLASFLPMEAIGEDGQLDLERERPISELESGFTYFRNGDVTIAKITPCYENGKGAYMTGLKNGIGFGTTELIVIRPQTERLDGRFMQYLTTASEFRNLGESHMYGAGGQKRVPESFVRNFELAFPPISEQARIVSFLDRETAKIDELITEQERLMELLKEKRQAVISHAVTKGLNPHAPMKDSGVEWLGKVPAHWKISRLGRVSTDRCDGPFGSGIKSDHYTESGTRVIRLQNIRSDGFADSDAAFIDTVYVQENLNGHDVVAEDVLLAGLGDDRNLVGRACVAPRGIEPALVKADCFRFRLDRSVVVPMFVAHQLSSGASYDGGILSTGSTRSRIPLSTMATRPVAFPTVDEQQRIVRFIEHELQKLDHLLSDAAMAVGLLAERRTALISAAVTGQIDVRHLANADAA